MSPMRWGGGYPVSYGAGAHQMDVPMVPAPVALLAMVCGLMIGAMIGRKKAMMHMRPDIGYGGTGWGDWSMRDHMMSRMAAHHHHGNGMPSCECGAEGVSGAADHGEGE